MRVIQLNTNHCATAQDILFQTICELKADIAIISEQYKNLDKNVWEKDLTGRAAVWACGGKAIEEGMQQQQEGFARAKIGGIYVYSCYASPNIPMSDFERLIDNLAGDVFDHRPAIIGGDFNAWAVDWGSQRTNERGRVLLDAFSRLDLVLANRGNSLTFRRASCGSIVDLTFVSQGLARNIDWRVSEHYTHSDHQAIVFEIRSGSLNRHRREKAIFHGWAKEKLDPECFVEVFANYNITDGSVAEMSEQVVASMRAACDASMPRRRRTQRRVENFWWNEEIASLRRQCLAARRKYQRGRLGPDQLWRRNTYNQARKDLQRAINRSKSECFRQLCKESDADPWGGAYRIVMARLRGKKTPQVTCPDLMDKIVNHLFPGGPPQEEFGHGPEEILPQEAVVSEEEIIALCSRIGDNKAPGLDSIPNKALKLALKTRPRLFADLFNKCLREGVFYSKWREQKLILIPKPGKTLGEPQSYRPICLLDTIGKCLERIIYGRLQLATDRVNGISNMQFGFRKSRSTIDAINLVVEMARGAILGKGRARKYCAIITLDIKNAFNSAGWSEILSAMRNKNIPSYLIKIVRNYFSDRILWFETDNGLKSYKVTGGVPQGSVLGPLLWNIMYDGVFRLQLPEEAKIVGFADDIAIIVRAGHIEDVRLYANEAIKKVKSWLESVNLSLADHKTESVLISGKRRIERLTLQVGNSTIVSSREIKYLGVMIDDRLNFRTHLEYACKKATGVSNALARLMPNIGGPRQSRRKLISHVTNSILLYGAPVWENLVKKSNKRDIISLFRRSCLRVCSGYRTISMEASSVIAGIIPLEITAKELADIYHTMGKNPNTVKRTLRLLERNKSIQKWQRWWDSSTKGRWTHRLIPNIKTWIARNHGEVNYNITQFLSGHGGYRWYLHRFGHDTSPRCPACPSEDETAEHVILSCPRFMDQRRQLESVVGENLTAENVIASMLKSVGNWEAVDKFIEFVNRSLRLAERLRKAEGASRP